jgi:D-inositol-3-phosphate glycosyltransferase
MKPGPYRIASYCSSPSWGGLEMNVLHFLRWMRGRGWEAVFYGDPGTRIYRQAADTGILVRPVISHRRFGDFINAWRLARRARQDNVRRLIVHRSPDLFLGVMARCFSRGNTRLIFCQHMHIGKNKKDPYHAWLYRRIDAFVTPVAWLAERVLEKTSVMPKDLHIIPHGIEIERFTAGKPSREAARRRFGLPPDAWVAGLIGRLDPKKGQDMAIKAIAAMHGLGHRPHLLLVGDQSFDEGDDYARGIHRLVDELRMNDYVHFFPHHTDVEWAYAALDVFVLASKSECYGMVTVEALVSGLPVVGTNDGGTISLIDHGRNGFLVEPRNVDALATALTALIENRDQVVRMGASAQKEAVLKYSHVSQCESWERVFEDLN